MTLHHEFLHADTRIESAEVGEDEAISRHVGVSVASRIIASKLTARMFSDRFARVPEKKHVLWASVIEQENEPLFLVCLMQKAPPTGFMRLFGSHEKNVSVAERDGFGLSALPDLFRLFYRGDFDVLAKAIKSA